MLVCDGNLMNKAISLLTGNQTFNTVNLNSLLRKLNVYFERLPSIHKYDCMIYTNYW
jgi:hypothetical protein